MKRKCENKLDLQELPEVILVGNKNDVWQERQVATDKACQVCPRIHDKYIYVIHAKINHKIFKKVGLMVYSRRQRMLGTLTTTRSPPGRVWTR